MAHRQSPEDVENLAGFLRVGLLDLGQDRFQGALPPRPGGRRAKRFEPRYAGQPLDGGPVRSKARGQLVARDEGRECWDRGRRVDADPASEPSDRPFDRTPPVPGLDRGLVQQARIQWVDVCLEDARSPGDERGIDDLRDVWRHRCEDHGDLAQDVMQGPERGAPRRRRSGAVEPGPDSRHVGFEVVGEEGSETTVSRASGLVVVVGEDREPRPLPASEDRPVFDLQFAERAGDRLAERREKGGVAPLRQLPGDVPPAFELPGLLTTPIREGRTRSLLLLPPHEGGADRIRADGPDELRDAPLGDARKEREPDIVRDSDRPGHGRQVVDEGRSTASLVEIQPRGVPGRERVEPRPTPEDAGDRGEEPTADRVPPQSARTLRTGPERGEPLATRALEKVDRERAGTGRLSLADRPRGHLDLAD